MVGGIGEIGASAPFEGRGGEELPAANVGGKAANLIHLKGVLTAAKIPAFIPLSNTHIKAYIKEMIPGLEGDWSHFCSLIREREFCPRRQRLLCKPFAIR